MRKQIFILLGLALLCSCSDSEKNNEKGTDEETELAFEDYAKFLDGKFFDVKLNEPGYGDDHTGSVEFTYYPTGYKDADEYGEYFNTTVPSIMMEIENISGVEFLFTKKSGKFSGSLSDIEMDFYTTFTDEVPDWNDMEIEASRIKGFYRSNTDFFFTVYYNDGYEASAEPI